MTVVLTEPFNNTTAWTTPSHTIVAGGVVGNCGQIVGSGVSTFPIPVGQQGSITDVEFWYQVNSLTANRHALQLRLSAGTNNQATLRIQTNGAIAHLRGGTTGTVLGASSAGVLTTNTWYKIRWTVKLGVADGEVKILVNDRLQLSLINVDTTISNASATPVDQFLLTGPGTSITSRWDELTLTIASTAAELRVARSDIRILVAPPIESLASAQVARIDLRSIVNLLPGAAQVARTDLRALTVLITEAQVARVDVRVLGDVFEIPPEGPSNWSVNDITVGKWTPFTPPARVPNSEFFPNKELDVHGVLKGTNTAAIYNGTYTSFIIVDLQNYWVGLDGSGATGGTSSAELLEYFCAFGIDFDYLQNDDPLYIRTDFELYILQTVVDGGASNFNLELRVFPWTIPVDVNDMRIGSTSPKWTDCKLVAYLPITHNMTPGRYILTDAGLTDYIASVQGNFSKQFFVLGISSFGQNLTSTQNQTVNFATDDVFDGNRRPWMRVHYLMKV